MNFIMDMVEQFFRFPKGEWGPCVTEEKRKKYPSASLRGQ